VGKCATQFKRIEQLLPDGLEDIERLERALRRVQKKLRYHLNSAREYSGEAERFRTPMDYKGLQQFLEGIVLTYPTKRR
jgi:predicted glycosyltransferase involved in capsule biosynthesis